MEKKEEKKKKGGQSSETDSAGYQQQLNKKQTFQMIGNLDLEIREFALVLQVFLKRKKQNKE